MNFKVFIDKSFLYAHFTGNGAIFIGRFHLPNTCPRRGFKMISGCQICRRQGTIFSVIKECNPHSFVSIQCKLMFFFAVRNTRCCLCCYDSIFDINLAIYRVEATFWSCRAVMKSVYTSGFVVSITMLREIIMLNSNWTSILNVFILCLQTRYTLII